MAKIWFVHEGLKSNEHPAAEKPVTWCQATLGLQPTDWLIGLATGFTLGKKTDLSLYSNSRWVIFEVEEVEANDIWKSGYYYCSSIKSLQARMSLS